jgi:hypothetical protein
MKTWRMIRSGWLGVLALLTGLASGWAEQAEPPVWHRQIWVPSGELDSVLAKMNRPVLLNAEEYQSLVKEASAIVATPAPKQAVLRSLVMTGEIHESVLVISAAYAWENLQDGRTEVTMPLPQANLAALPAEDGAVEVRLGTDGKPVAILEGRGMHRLKARFQLPVTPTSDGFEAHLDALPFAPASLRIRFDDGISVSANAPVLAERGGDHLFSMPSGGEGLVLRWRRSGKDAVVPVAVRQTCRFLYFLDESGLQADLGIVLTAELSDLPGELRFALPAGNQVVDVSGASVSHWNATDGMLSVTTAPGSRSPLRLRVLLERGALAEGAETAKVSLPMLRAEGATRVEGRLDVFGGPGIRVESVASPAWFFPVAVEQGTELERHAACQSALEFPAWEGASPQILLRRFVPRVHARLDTLVSVEAEVVRLRHDLVFSAQDGEVFRSVLHLGAGERLEGVEVTGTEPAESHAEAGTIQLDWKNGLEPGREGRVRIRTRLDSKVWNRERESGKIVLIGAQVDADTQDGYFAVTTAPDCEVSVRREEGLQARDPRRTPVSGELAWRRTGASSLELEVARLRPAYDVHLTAFVVPDSKKVEIEGQIDVAIRHSAIGELQFAFAPELAGLVRFSSPLISGQWPDLSKGVVTVRFHHDLTGFQQLRWRMTLPVTPEQVGNEIRFAAPLPKVDVPGASRITGQWMIEAMNDTSVTVESRQAKAFDALRVPAISGYTPSYRVVAALDHRGADHGIVIRSLQHVNRPVLGLVVRRLMIDTVVSEEGREIHDTDLMLDNRAAAEVKLGIPLTAQVTALAVDGVSQRPVVAGGPSDGIRQWIRVALPKTGQIAVRLSYVQGGLPWGRSGGARIAPVRLDTNLPVQETTWRFHLPESYRFERFTGGARPMFAEQPGALLPLIWAQLKPALQAMMGWSHTKSQGVDGADSRGSFAFHGEQGPEELRFRYAHQELAMRYAWAWILGGLVGYWVLSAARPVVVGLTGVALLTFLPVSGLTDLVSVANGLLTGWLLMFLLTQTWRLLSVLVKASGPRELPAQ